MDEEQLLRYDIGFIIKRLVIWPRRRRDMDDLTRDSIADEIVKHLKLSNWRFTKGTESPWHSTTSGRKSDPK